MAKNCITLAVAKGYLFDKSLELLRNLGYEFDEDVLESRQLFVDDVNGRIRLLRIRPWDVPVYVEGGVADLGIVGKDVLLEKDASVTELIDLQFGGCQLVLAGPEDLSDDWCQHNIRVATKFVNSCREYFRKRGVKYRSIELYGAVELAPITGLSDIICDLSATGQTLKDHNLKILDEVFSSTARLISNQSSLRLRYEEICRFVDSTKPFIS